MKGKGYLFEVAAIGYLRNHAGDITETDILYPITSILSKDRESAKFELVRRLPDKDIEKYGSDSIEFIVREFVNRSVAITGYATTSITF